MCFNGTALETLDAWIQNCPIIKMDDYKGTSFIRLRAYHLFKDKIQSVIWVRSTFPIRIYFCNIKPNWR